MYEDDFKDYSALGSAIPNPSIIDAEGYFNLFGWTPGAEEVENIVTYSRDNYDNLAIMSAGGILDTVGDLRYINMTDDEVAIYNYLLAKSGKEKAGEFLSYLDETLNARAGKQIADSITSIDIPVVEELATGLYGFGAGVDQWTSGVKQVFSKEQLPTSVTQYANAEIMNSLDGFGKYAYTATNVLGNMAPSILLSSLTAGLGAPVVAAQGLGATAVGLSAAGNAYGSALRDGYSVGQARAYSTLVGVAEGGLQALLGGIGSLGGVTDDLIKAKINMIDNSLLRVSAKLGADVFSEVAEEELQNFLEPAFRSIIFGEAYDAPTIDEIIETAIVTAGTTLVLGGGDTVSSDLSEHRQLTASGQKIMDTNNGLGALVNSAKEVMPVSSKQTQKTLTKQIDQVGQKPTARNIGQLNATVQTATNQAMQTEVAKQLASKGISPKKADGIAEAIVARINGQELNRTQRNILSSALGSSAVRDTISNLLQTKSNVVDSTQNRVYDESNISNGSTNAEQATAWNLPDQSVDVLDQNDTTETVPPAIQHSQNTSSESSFERSTDVTGEIITDGSHLENGKLKPNVTYKTGEHDYFYTTNDDGLIVNARTDDLQLKTHEGRYKHNPNTYGKELGDHAGHLFGDRFGGSPELDNLVSQAENVNRSEYRQIEEQWAKALKNGQKVSVNIDIHYDQGSARPSSFDVTYTIDGVQHKRKISNQSGGSK